MMTTKIFPKSPFEQNAFSDLKDATDRIKALRLRLGLSRSLRRNRQIMFDRILKLSQKPAHRRRLNPLIKLLDAIRDEAYAQGMIKAILEKNEP